VLITDETVGAALGFRGSPTIRIDGRDVRRAGNEEVRLSCRLYPGSPRLVFHGGLVHRAVVAAEKRADHEAGDRHLASFGAVLSSVATISCCLPLGFAAALGLARRARSSRPCALAFWDSPLR